MIRRYLAVLRDRRGAMNGFLFAVLAVTLMFATAGAVMIFQHQNVQTAQHQLLLSAIESRANQYLGEMNRNLETNSAAAPPLGSIANPRTGLTTVIDSATDSAGGKVRTLTITARNGTGSFKLTRAIALNRSQVTHVSGFESGQPVWVKANEPNPLNVWSGASGDIRELTPEEEKGISVGTGRWATLERGLGLDKDGVVWQFNDMNLRKVNGTSGYQSIASDGSTFLGINSGGKLFAWGANSKGSTGTGQTGATVASPTAVGPSITFQSVTAGAGSVFAIDTRGTLYAWGDNTNGRLGIADTGTVIRTPQEVVTPTTFVQVTTSGGSTLAIDTAGRLWAVGENTSGQLGDGTTARRNRLVQVGTKTWQAVSTSGFHTVAVDSALKLFAWGTNASGQLGTNNTTATLVPVAVSSGKTYTSVAAYGNTSYAIDTSGRLNVWGDNSGGRYGKSGAASRVPVETVPTVQFRSIAASANGVAVVDMFGDGWAFGHTGQGLWNSGLNLGPATAMKMPTVG